MELWKIKILMMSIRCEFICMGLIKRSIEIAFQGKSLTFTNFPNLFTAFLPDAIVSSVWTSRASHMVKSRYARKQQRRWYPCGLSFSVRTLWLIKMNIYWKLSLNTRLLSTNCEPLKCPEICLHLKNTHSWLYPESSSRPMVEVLSFCKKVVLDWPSLIDHGITYWSSTCWRAFGPNSDTNSFNCGKKCFPPRPWSFACISSNAIALWGSEKQTVQNAFYIKEGK